MGQACLELLLPLILGEAGRQAVQRRETPGVDPARLGLFGHSQGGWVVLEVAAADPSIALVITSSGPGVTMADQERFATEAHMTAAGAPAEAVAGALATQDALMTLVRAGADFETVQAAAGDDGHGPGDDAEIELVRRWLDHDPRPALEQLTCPLLAIFGEQDLVTPVEESVAVFRAARAGRSGRGGSRRRSRAVRRLESYGPGRRPCAAERPVSATRRRPAR